MFGFKKNKDRLEEKPMKQDTEPKEKMLWEITGEIIDRADQATIDNWDRNLAEARERLGMENKDRERSING